MLLENSVLLEFIALKINLQISLGKWRGAIFPIHLRALFKKKIQIWKTQYIGFKNFLRQN